MILLMSPGIFRIPLVSSLLGQQVGLRSDTNQLSAVAGWGRKKSGRQAERYASRYGVPCWWLEDGFLRSFGTGEHFPPLSLAVDEQGIYYDSTRPSALESLLASTADLLDGIAADVARAKALVLGGRLSKYNHAPLWDLADFSHHCHQNRPLPAPLPHAGEGERQGLPSSRTAPRGGRGRRVVRSPVLQ